jgi:hypothetical protein
VKVLERDNMMVLSLVLGVAFFLSLFTKDAFSKWFLFFFFILSFVLGYMEINTPKVIVRDYGCVVKKNNGLNSSPYVFIVVDGKRKRFSLDGYTKIWDENSIGKCSGFFYYENVIGRNIFVGFDG